MYNSMFCEGKDLATIKMLGTVIGRQLVDGFRIFIILYCVSSLLK